MATGMPTVEPDAYRPGYVYLVRSPRTGWFKIGSTGNVTSRLQALSRQVEAPCVLVHLIACNNMLRLEREAQHRFMLGHIGAEWFELSAEEVAVFCCVSSVTYHSVRKPVRGRAA